MHFTTFPVKPVSTVLVRHLTTTPFDFPSGCAWLACDVLIVFYHLNGALGLLLSLPLSRRIDLSVGACCVLVTGCDVMCSLQDSTLGGKLDDVTPVIGVCETVITSTIQVV